MKRKMDGSSFQLARVGINSERLSAQAHVILSFEHVHFHTRDETLLISNPIYGKEVPPIRTDRVTTEFVQLRNKYRELF